MIGISLSGMKHRAILLSCVAVVLLAINFQSTHVNAVRKKLLSCGSSSVFGCITGAGNKLKMSRAFDEINVLLEKDVKSDDVEDNMRFVANLITTRALKPNPGDDFLNALVTLHELTLNDGPGHECTLSSYEKLLKNNRFMRDPLGHLSSKAEPKRRIDRLLLSFARKHSDSCDNYYLNEYQDKIKQVNEAHLKRVREFIPELIKLRLVKKSRMLEKLSVNSSDEYLQERPIEASKFVRSIKLFATNDDYKTAVRYLVKSLSQDESSGGYSKVALLNKFILERSVSHQDKVQMETLIRDHLMNPCREFEQTLGSAFKVDLSIINSRDLKPDDEIRKQFYRDLTLYRGCLILHRSAAKMADGVLDMTFTKLESLH